MADGSIGFQPETGKGENDTDIRRALRAARMANGGIIMPERPIWDQFQRASSPVTPVALSNIIRRADTGDIRELMDVGNDERQKDGHLSSVLSQSEETIGGLEWKLELPQKSKKRDRDVCEWVENHLRHKVAEPFATLITSLAGAVFYGFDVNESLWSKDEKKRLVPIDFIHREHRRFRFRDADGKLVWCDPGMPLSGVDFRIEFPNRFIVATPRVTGDVPSREGLIRVLSWASLCRNWSLTDWLRTGEIGWKPWRIAKFKKGASQTDIDGLYRVLDLLASTGAAALPETADLEVAWPGGTSSSKPTHAELFNVIAQEMSKAVLGQTETTQASTASGYAQAKVHMAVRENILKARARHIAAVITRDVIRPMVELNFGMTMLVPAMTFVTSAPTDLQAFGIGIKNLAKDANLRIPSKYVRSTAGIPEPEADEECIGGVKPPEPVTGPTGASGGTGDAGASGSDGEGAANPSATETNPEDNQGPAADSGDAGGGD